MLKKNKINTTFSGLFNNTEKKPLCLLLDDCYANSSFGDNIYINRLLVEWMIKMSLGKRLKEARERCGLSQNKLPKAKHNK